MSRALDIVLALKARLQAIRVANGFITEAGFKVYLGRAFLDSEKDTPSLTLHEGRPQKSGYGFVENTSANPQIGGRMEPEYTVEGMVQCNGDEPYVAAHALLADIKRALFGTQDALPNTLSHRLVGYGVMPHQPGSTSMTVLVVGAYQFVENFAAP